VHFELKHTLDVILLKKNIFFFVNASGAKLTSVVLGKILDVLILGEMVNFQKVNLPKMLTRAFRSFYVQVDILAN